MNGTRQEEPQVVTYRIPAIEVYEVSGDELTRIEEGYGQVGQDLMFAIASLSIAVSFVIALFTATFPQTVFFVFIAVVLICVAVCLYTGLRWWGRRRKAPEVIARIRSRKLKPEVRPETN